MVIDSHKHPVSEVEFKGFHLHPQQAVFFFSDNFPAAHCGNLPRDNDARREIRFHKASFCRYFHPIKDAFQKPGSEVTSAAEGNLCVREKDVGLYFL